MTLVLSMVAFDDQPAPSVADIQQFFSQTWTDIPAIANVSQQDTTFSFCIGGADVVIGVMPAPMSWADLEGPCATSILWPDASKELKTHTNHVIVTVSGELNPIELSTRLTQATAALMATSNHATGVFWYNSRAVIRKDIFIDFAKDILPLGPPLPLWVDTRVGQTENNLTAGFTSGMAALGHMEIEAENAPESVSDLRDRLIGLMDYLIENGAVISDGDTIGVDEQERIRVIFVDSVFGHEAPVMRLVYENTQPQKSWWKPWQK
jgi:Domain of unknown function (DUF4261)